VRDADELVEQVRITVLHELGHHLGMDEDDLARLGYA
jgi:predicted Zn-dependent protease with MMP-like domain